VRVSRYAGAAGAAVALTMTGGLLPSQASAAPITLMYMQGAYGGKCLEVENSSGSNGARVQSWNCNWQNGAYWRLVPKSDGYYEIRNYSGKCLEIENSSKANGARAQQWECKGQAGSRWRFKAGTRGNIVINKSSGKCLEIENSSLSNGARAQQWDCKYQDGSNWYVPWDTV
jgi:hypothetical protein